MMLTPRLTQAKVESLLSDTEEQRGYVDRAETWNKPKRWVWVSMCPICRMYHASNKSFNTLRELLDNRRI